MSRISKADYDSIIQNLVESEVSGVIAPPGTGKSTALIKHLYETFDSPKIFIIEPTVVSCHNLKTFMTTQIPKATIGTATEGEVKYNNALLSDIRGNKTRSREPDTDVIYCTSGHMRKIFLDCVRYAFSHQGGENFEGCKLVFADFIMLDEAHSGSVDNDMIMRLYDFLRKGGASLPRLLLSSANLKMEETPFRECPVFRIPTASYDVIIEYHPYPIRPEDPRLYQEVAQVVKSKHIISQVPLRGSDVWLVFCAGSREVEEVVKLLSDVPGMEVLPIYSNLGSETVNKIFDPIPSGVRRVIVATNIAEVAITINDLSGIFDTMAEKYTEESSTGGTRLALHKTSKASCEQRAGRTGRTRPGFCYRMISSSSYESDIPPSRPSEIQRIPVHSIVLELINVDIKPQSLFPHLEERFRESLATLKQLSMYSTNPFRVTEKGRFSNVLDFSLRGSCVLYEWCQLRNDKGEPYPLFPPLVIIALIETFGPSYFWYPTKDASGEKIKDYKEYREKYFAKYDGENDLLTLANMWTSLYSRFAEAGLNKLQPPRELTQYCVENSLNNKKIVELVRNIRLSMNSLNRFFHGKKPIVVGPFNPVNVMKILLPIMKTVYSDRVLMRVKKNYVSSPDSSIFYNLDKRTESIRNPLQPDPQELLALIVFESNVNRITMRHITLSIPSDGIIGIELSTGEPSSLREGTDSPRREKKEEAEILEGMEVNGVKLPDINTGVNYPIIPPVEWIKFQDPQPLPVFEALPENLVPLVPDIDPILTVEWK